MTRFDTLAAHEAARLGVHRTTLVAAIRAGQCAGEERDGKWYTSSHAAAAWYEEHYRHKAVLYSKAAGRPWGEADVRRLREMVLAGHDHEEIGQALKREPNAIKVKASKLRAAGKLPPAAETKRARSKRLAIEEARRVLAEQGQADEKKLDWYQERRQQEREGRVRLHLHPEVKRLLGAAAKRHGIPLAWYVTRAGLAAVADPGLLQKGLREEERLGIKRTSSDSDVD